MGRKNRSSIRKPEILENFNKVISKEGYAGATLEKIARRMGVHSSLLVHYFKTKENMMVELVDWATENFEKFILEKITNNHTNEDSFEELLNILFSREWTMVVDKGVFYTCLDLSFRNKKIKEHLYKMYLRLKEGITLELEKFMNQGIIRKADPEKTAVLIMSLLEGFHVYNTFLGENPSFEELSEYFKDLVTRMLKNEA